MLYPIPNYKVAAMKIYRLFYAVFIFGGILSACSTQPQHRDRTMVELKLGCTQDIVTYKKELKILLEESQDQNTEERLKKIIKYVECNPEKEN